MAQTVKDLLLSASAVLSAEGARLVGMAQAQRTADDKREIKENSDLRFEQGKALALLAQMYGPVLQDLVDLRDKGENHRAEIAVSKEYDKEQEVFLYMSHSVHEFTLEEGQ